jgi:iron complex transport system substrate-binding protein
MRIVSLLASATEILCALGAGDSLVGRSHECDNPSWVRRLPVCSSPAFDVTLPSRAIDTEVRRRLAEKLPLYHLDVDLIRDLKPDLLITQAHCEVCAVTPGNVADAGCTIAGSQILALQAGTIAGIFDGIATIAAAIDRPAAGHQLVQQLQSRLNAVHFATTAKRRPFLVMLEWTDPVFAMANWGPELVQFANGRLLLGDPGKHSAAIDWSHVRDADPDFLLIAPCGYNLDRALREIPTMESYPGWHDLRAVKNRRVAFADGNLFFNRSGTTIVETAQIIADILHGTSLHRTSPKAWQWYEPASREHSTLRPAPLNPL